MSGSNQKTVFPYGFTVEPKRPLVLQGAMVTSFQAAAKQPDAKEERYLENDASILRHQLTNPVLEK